MRFLRSWLLFVGLFPIGFGASAFGVGSSFILETKVLWSENSLAGFKEIFFSQDGDRLFTKTNTYGGEMWNVATGEVEAVFERDIPLAFTALHPSGLRLAACDFIGACGIWDTLSGSQILEFETQRPLNMEFSPDGDLLLIRHEYRYSGDVIGRVWDVATGELLHILEDSSNGYKGFISGFSPDSSKLLISATGVGLRLLDARTGEEHLVIEERRFGYRWRFEPAKFSFSGSWIVGTISDGAMVIWSAETGKKVRTIRSEEGPFTRFFMSPNEEKVLGMTDFGFHSGAEFYSLLNGQKFFEIRGEEGILFPRACAQFTADGRYLVTDGVVEGRKDLKFGILWSSANGKEVGRFPPVVSGGSHVCGINLNSDSRYAISFSHESPSFFVHRLGLD